MKKLLYTLFTTVLFITTAFSQGEQRYANGSATDQEGNSFEWINYGAQDWAIENAEVVTYRDGTEIPQVTDATEWANLTTGAWCYYDNDPSKGKLYNWYAVAGIHDNDPNTPNKEFAPEGWHVPTYAEWTTLEEYLIANGYNYDGTVTGNKIAKAMASTTGWDSSIWGTGTGAVGNDQSLNNSSGFNGSPEGRREGSFYSKGNYALFWSSTESSFYTGHAWILGFYKADYGLSANENDNISSKWGGSSVRFVRETSSIGAYGILLNGTVSAENNQIKNVADPTEAQDAATKAYIDALITSLQSQIDALQPTSVTDQDGNTYDFIAYGDQVWTVENAEMVTYRDGTPIPQVTDNTAWENLTTGAWAYYDNDPTKPRLYNWYAVMGIHDTDPNTPNKEFAPEGWHVPSDAEWTTLENYLIANGYNYDGTTSENKIAKAMASTTGWNSSTDPGAPGNDQSLNNSSGFNAFPVGDRTNDGSFINEGNDAKFWSTAVNDPNNAYIRLLLNYRSDIFGTNLTTKPFGFSVRFVKDN